MAYDDEDAAMTTIRPREANSNQAPPLPDDYRISVIDRILEMCSKDMYTNMEDFEWYIGVLVELVKQCPSNTGVANFGQGASSGTKVEVADRIGIELLSVTVRVKAVREEASSAAQSLLMHDTRDELFPTSAKGGHGVLRISSIHLRRIRSLPFESGCCDDLPNASIKLSTSCRRPHRLPASHSKDLCTAYKRPADGVESVTAIGRGFTYGKDRSLLRTIDATPQPGSTRARSSVPGSDAPGL